jgi:conjugal transfer mating pair stabilization protein TraN
VAVGGLLRGVLRMGAASWFSEYPGTTRAICASLALVLFWTPVYRAVADAMQDSAKLGQAAARKSIQDFPLPAVSEDGQTLTLFPGTGQDLDIPAQALFPDSGNGQASTFTNLYGDNANAVSAGLGAQTTLKTEANPTGEAYRTLVKAANRSHPDLTNDPVWGSTDYVMANHDLFAKDFADCTSTTVFKDTNFSARLPDYKTCMRGPNPPPNCTANRQYTVSRETAEVKLGTVGKHDVSFTFDLRNGTGSWWSDIGAGGQVVVPKLDYAKICDGSGAYKIRHIKTVGWTDSGLWGSDGGYQVDDSVSQGLSQMPSCANGLVGKFWQHDVGDGDWVMAAKLYFSAEKIEAIDWLWSNARCPDLMNAIQDNLCPSASVTCSADPGVYNGTQKCFEYNGVQICESDLPDPLFPNLSKTCSTVSLATDCDFGGTGSTNCWTDINGATVCPGDFAGQGQIETCKTLEQQGCAFIRSDCVDGTTGDATGTCWLYKDVYDCGTTTTIPTTEGSTKQECAGPVRCMGEECVAIDRRQSKDFTRAVAALNAAQQMAMDTGCETVTNYQQGQGFEFTTCSVFKGEGGTCKTVGALVTSVDCCNAPTSIGLGEYIDLITNISQMNNAVMRLDATNAVRSGWEVLSGPVTDAWSSVTELYAGAVDSTIGQFSETAADFLKSSLIEEFSALAMEKVATWVGETFGGAAGNLIFSSGGAAAFSESGALNPGVTGSTLQVGGGAAMIGSMLNVIMIAYAVYQILVMIVQLIWQCEQKEYELAAKKSLKACTYLGSYCATKVLGMCVEERESYCCFSSPLARILQEQVRPQLGLSFGDKKSPDCSGIPIEKLADIDWSRVNLDEWIAILQSTNHLPTAANAAQKLNLDQLTGQGSRFNVDGTRLNTLDRNVERKKGLDIPAIRDQAEGEGWGMGPKN